MCGFFPSVVPTAISEASAALTRKKEATSQNVGVLSDRIRHFSLPAVDDIVAM